MVAEVTGYLHPAYADSLTEVGVPRHLTRSGAWILQRNIPGTSKLDAMGVYPMMLCRDWSGLAADLDEIGDDLVCLGVVTDPFGDYDESYLRHCFRDWVLAFKDHFVIDLRRPPETIGSRHHKYKVRRASKTLQVEVCESPVEFAQDWIDLYGLLALRHNIRGVTAFSPCTLTAQLTVPGLVMSRAVQNGETVGVRLFYVIGNIAYSHLSAFNDEGYSAGASYALMWLAIQHIAGLGVRYLDLGGGAGVDSSATDGLSSFKRGWATDTRTAYFCGRIFDLKAYRAICASAGAESADYFPAYRRGEFG